MIGNNVTAVTVNSNLIGNNVTAVTVNSNLIGNNVTAVTVNSNVIGNNVSASFISGNGDLIFRKYTIAGAGSGEYSVIGPGFDTATANPTLTLMRGQKYVFDNTAHHSFHPLEIRDGYQGSAYTSGVIGGGTATITFTVPMNAPLKLYYQCTYHPAMGNTIYIPLENLDTSQTLNLSNDLVVGTDKLVVDVSESRVGINNASPSKDLDVTGEIACSSHLTVGGNLTVNGTTTTVNTTSLRVEDTLIELGKNNTAGTSDLGLILKRPTGVGLKSNVAIVYSESVDTLKFGHTLSGSDATPVVFDTSNALAMSLNGSFVATGTVRGSSSLTPGSYLTGSAYDGGSNQTFTVDATDANTAGKVVARDGSGNFSAGTITASMSTSLTPGSYLSGSAYNGGTARTFDVDATDANTPNKVVARDASGNFSAGTITAALSGNATTAAALQTARNINGVSFDGTENITITANTPNTLTPGSYLTGSDFDGGTARTFNVDATTTNTAGKVVARDASGNFSAGTITADLSGTATTATTATNQSGGTVSATTGYFSSYIYTDGNRSVIRGGSPTLYFRETNEMSAMIHNNSNLLYILRGGTDTESWSQVNGQWPWYWDLSNNNSTCGGSLYCVGDVTAYSDKRVKTDISKIKDPLNKVCSINGYTYKRTDTDDDKTHTGVLAQEVMEVLPEVVHGSEDTTYSVAYGNMVGLLIEAIKELKLEIDELKKSR